MSEEVESTECDEEEKMSHTVFYHAKKSGCDDDEAERVAKAVGEIRYNRWDKKLGRWAMARVKQIGAALTLLLGGILAILSEEILEIIQNIL